MGMRTWQLFRLILTSVSGKSRYSVRCSRPMASTVSWFKYRPVRAMKIFVCGGLVGGDTESELGGRWKRVDTCEAHSEHPCRAEAMGAVCFELRDLA